MLLFIQLRKLSLALAITQILILPVAQAATIVVNNFGDTSVNDNDCTLREAIISANTNPGNTVSGCISGTSGEDTVSFIPVGAGQTIVLSEAPALSIDSGESLIINGPGAGLLTIDGNKAARTTTGIFSLIGATASINGLTISNGARDHGGGIYAVNFATVNLMNSVVSDNMVALDGNGGGIFAYNNSNITVINSTVSGNSAETRYGGGINATESSTVTLTNSTVSGNVALRGGGIMANSGSTVTLTNNTVSDNVAEEWGGGIMANSGSTVTLTNNIVSDNVAEAWGGGIMADSSTVTLTNSTVSDNVAEEFGGGIIANSGSTLDLDSSTVSGNSTVDHSGGGIMVSSSSTGNLSNSTVSGNYADNLGGGISANNSSLSLTNTTVSGNIARIGGAGISVRATAGNSSSANLSNSVIAYSSGDAAESTDCYMSGDGTTSVTADVHNIIADGSCVSLTNTALSGDPLLDSLADNGGPTKTHKLSAGSPAIEAGDNAVCAAEPVNNLDQRGFARPEGTACDIGAFEFKDYSQGLTILKDVTNNNSGTADPADFTLHLTGGTTLGTTYDGTEEMKSGDTPDVEAGTPYSLSETALPGYTETGIACTDDDGGAAVTHPVNLSVGQDVTCTISNEDDAVAPPQLTLVKTVVNDNGGNAAANDFLPTVDGTVVVSGEKNAYFAGTPLVLNETLLPGYTFTSLTGDAKCPAALGGTITLAPGDDIMCEITNDDVAPQLTLIKVVNGGSAAPDDFSLAVGGGSVLSGAKNTYSANTPLALNETQLAGYTFTSLTGDAKCPAALGGTVTLAPGDDITCTITNTEVALTAQLTLVKTVVNDDGGNAVPDAFLPTVAGAIVVSGAKNTYSANTPLALDETLLPGYTFTSLTGDAKCPAALGGTVTLDPGDDITCTITNDDVAPQLTLTKVVNGGSAAPDDFSLTVGGGSVLSGAKNTYLANTPLALNESQLAGYTFTSLTGDPECPAALGGTVPLAPGDDITCTITNTEVALTAQLTLVKTVVNDDGGNAAPDAFLPTVAGAVVVSGAKNTYSANAPLALDETLLPGYTFTSLTGDAKCPAALGGMVTLDPGDDITCTITNDDVAPQLTLVKTVVNDNGGDVLPDAFLPTVDGAVVVSGAINTYMANTPLALNETLLPGYTFTSLTGDAKCPAALGDPITLAPGDDITCTITNDDVAPQLTLVKTVVNDNGGDALPDAFLLTVDGTVVVSGAINTYMANTPLALDETLLPGYTFTSLTGDAKCPAALGDPITLAPGDDITCTITNDDVAPQLTLVKMVVNDNGGTAAPDAFLPTVAGTVVVSGEKNTYLANTPLALDETLLPGYTFTSLTGDAKCPAALGDPITLAPGDDITCTITNDDVAPQLTLVKTVVNDNGGDALPDAFLPTVDGAVVVSGAINTYMANTPLALDETLLPGYTFTSLTGDAKCPAALGDSITLAPGDDITCTITNNDMQPGLTILKDVTNANGGTAVESDFTLHLTGGTMQGTTWTGTEELESGDTPDVEANAEYTLSETELPGYTMSGIRCSDDDGGAGVAHPMTLNEGQNVTCTISNSDVAAQLTLVKTVVNDNGGDALPDAFLPTVGGTVVVSGEKNAYSANTPLVLDETLLPGYTFTSLTGDAKCPAALGDPITLAPGDDITCTITNDDVAPQLTLVKMVVNDNGGTAAPDAFLPTVAGTVVVSGEKNTYLANTPLALDETLLPGYTFTSLTGDAKCPAALGDPITLASGDDITCTITNDDVAPQLTFVKTVVNDNGGDALPDAFLPTVDGTVVVSGEKNAYSANTPLVLDETLLPGYTFTSLTGDVKCPVALGDSITLAPGDDITCTITNDDMQPGLTILKDVTNVNGGTAVESDFTLHLTGGAWHGTEEFVSGDTPVVEANEEYTLSETEEPGYTMTGIRCTDDDGGAGVAHPVTLNEGQNVTCTISNSDDPDDSTYYVIPIPNGGTAVINL